jgi:hypothetical protein
MTLKISWLDFSDTDRRKMIEVISLFKQRDTRDEMGLAQIRDGFAELLFPGTTTLQTRARYFLFVPWIYIYYENLKTPSTVIADRVKKREIQLMSALRKGGETDGVIGRRSGASLQRFPSSIYWNGLRTWGIFKLHGTPDQYHRVLDHYYVRHGNVPDYESQEHIRDDGTNWNPNLPGPAEKFLDVSTFTLTNDEAEYLRERLLISCNQSLIAYLVDRCDPVDGIDFAWHHPQFSEFPIQLKDWLVHARNFSETMHGTALLYNLMLAEKLQSEKLITQYRDRIDKWYLQLVNNQTSYYLWNLDEFWKLSRLFGDVYSPTYSFVNAWLEKLLTKSGINNPTEHYGMRKIVYDREVWLKRNRSRLENQRHLELWSGDAGTGQLDFRWGVGNRLTRDIQFGLRDGRR